MSTLRVNNITDTSGGSSSLSVPGAAKAWVNFNGQGTVAIRAALNVSSISDFGTGYYGVNFTNALSDANYCVTAGVSNATYLEYWNIFDYPNGAYQNPFTTGFLCTFYGQGAYRDPLHVMLAIHR